MPTIAAQAREHGLPPALVYQRLSRGHKSLTEALATPRRPCVLPDLNRRRLLEELRTLSTATVAAKYGVGCSTVRNWRRWLGLAHPRKPKESTA